MAITDPERDSDNQNTGNEETEWGPVTDINSADTDCLWQSSIRYEK